MVDTWETFSAESDYAKSGDTVCQRSADQRHLDWQAAMLATNEYSESAADSSNDFPRGCEVDPRWIVGLCLLDADHSVHRGQVTLISGVIKIKKGGLLTAMITPTRRFLTWVSRGPLMSSSRRVA